jgi:DNA-binding transcriptional LysR family regulator
VLDALNTAGQALNQREESQTDVVRIGPYPPRALGILPAVIGPFHKQQMETTLHNATMSNPMILAGLKSGKSTSALVAWPIRN